MGPKFPAAGYGMLNHFIDDLAQFRFDLSSIIAVNSRDQIRTPAIVCLILIGLFDLIQLSVTCFHQCTLVTQS